MTGAGASQIEEIRTAGLIEFSTNGYPGTSLQAVATRAGCTKANVLYHFGSKRGLLDAVMEPVLEDADARRARIHAAGSRVDVAAEIVGLFLAHPDAVRLMLFHSRGFPDRVYARRVTEIFDGFGQDLSDGDADAHLRFGVAAAGLAYMLSSGDTYLSETDLSCLSPETLVTTLRDMIAAPTH